MDQDACVIEISAEKISGHQLTKFASVVLFVDQMNAYKFSLRLH